MHLVFLVIVILISNKDKVKAASIEGVKPSLEGIQDYSYPVQDLFSFTLKKLTLV
jgi:phosphate transport system substrate-binding protein